MQVLITGLGMVTSVGLDARSACAAIRAGIAQPKPLSYFEVHDDETQDTRPLAAHPIRGFSEGFVFMGLWLRLASEAVAGMIAQHALPSGEDKLFWQSTALVIVAPRLDDDRFAQEGTVPVSEEGVREYYVEPLLEMLELPIDPQNVTLFCVGQPGCAAAVQLAGKELLHRMPRALVLGADSLLDPGTLEWLAGHDRLKFDENARGFSPGQSAACLLLERPDSARRRKATAVAEIKGVALGQEPAHFFQGEQANVGTGLTAAIRQCLMEAGLADLRGDLIPDLNGEEWRAMEWGHTRAKLGPLLEGELVLPCSSVGDVGAASGVVNTCVAAMSLFKRYAGSSRVLVTSSSEWGDVGAILVDQA